MTRSALVTIALVLAAGVAAAHERTVSSSTWHIDGARARVTARLTPLDVSRLPWAAAGGPDVEARLGSYLAERLVLRSGGVPCPVTTPPARLATVPDRIAYTWEVTCPSAAALEIAGAVLLDVAPSHLHLARVYVGDAPSTERVLSDAERTWPIDAGAAGETTGDSIADFLMLGVEHILTGYDHLVFLLALLLLGGSLGDVVRIVTGFTVAHSITLGLAVAGVLRPEQAPIEALIGLSIALVAAENLWLEGGRRRAVRWAVAAVLLMLAIPAAAGIGVVSALTLAGLALFAACYLAVVARVDRPAPLRAAVAFVFGLVHGFGFAGVLLDAELPADRIARALFGFNAGVELGQVLAVLALWPFLRLSARVRGGALYHGIVDYGSAAILAVGVFWYASRTYG